MLSSERHPISGMELRTTSGVLVEDFQGKGTWLRPWTAFHMAIESNQHHFRCPQRS
ncbi:hypothetical protein BDV35DRAFT_373591 [Aspergillus flavus]|uniref:Uncharacterized protein n=1 Tax=Aspergillus flavus TaxID=5059 RepID=A0A5N6GDG5_ASPFL|nr:hypothetical protein BDV35DRAFT_373591 [Aspergillus flavus]